jgi:hypothetical protein
MPSLGWVRIGSPSHGSISPPFRAMILRRPIAARNF